MKFIKVRHADNAKTEEWISADKIVSMRPTSTGTTRINFESSFIEVIESPLDVMRVIGYTDEI